MMKITAKEVPLYLCAGALFETFDVSDTESFEVPAYKKDCTVQSHSDLQFLMRSLSFWAVDDLPVDVILFLIAHDGLELTQISAEFPDYDRWWKMIDTLKTYSFQDTIEGAIKVGVPLSVLQDLHVRGDFPLTAKACVAAGTSSAAESVKTLTYLHQQDCPWDSSTTDAAARSGNLPCLMYAHENGCGLSSECLNIAAAAGQLASIKYLRSVGEPIHPIKTIDAAVNSNYLKLEVIQYLCESGCELTELMLVKFATFGSLECMIYAHERGCPWRSEVCLSAAYKGHIHCLKYAYLHGCPWDSFTTGFAATAGQYECLKYAHSRGCPLTNIAMDCAIRAGSWQCFWYTLKNGCFSVHVFSVVLICISSVCVLLFNEWSQIPWPILLLATGHIVECILDLFREHLKPLLSYKTQDAMRTVRWWIQLVCLVLQVKTMYQLLD